MHPIIAAMGRPLTQVTFGAAGTGASEASASPIDVPYPAGIVARSFLILHTACLGAILRHAVTTPSGWTEIGATSVGAGEASQVFYRIADGSESGSLSVAYSTGTGITARMYRLSHGSGVEAYADAIDDTSDTTVDAVNVTTLGPLRLAVQAMWQSANTTIGNISGESGADYAEAAAEFAVATFGLLSLQVAQVATAAAITGGSATAGSSGVDRVHGFAVIP